MQTNNLEIFKINNKDISIIKSLFVISLVLFASIIAPKLPSCYLEIIDNMFVKFLLFTGIAYLATYDLVSAIIASIAVLVTLQTLSVHRITNNIIDATKQILEYDIQPYDTQNIQTQEIQTQENNFNIDFSTLLNSSNPLVPSSSNIMSNFSTNIMIDSSKNTMIDSSKNSITQTVVIESSNVSSEDPYLKLRDFLNNIKESDPTINLDSLFKAVISSNPNLDPTFVKEIINSTFNIKSVDNYVKSVDNYVKSVDIHDKSFDNYVKSIDIYDKPFDIYDKPFDNYNKPIDNYDKPIDNYDKQIDNYDKPIDNYDKLIDNYDKPIDNYIKPIDNYIKPIINNVLIKHPKKVKFDPIIKDMGKNNEPYGMLEFNDPDYYIYSKF